MKRLRMFGASVACVVGLVYILHAQEAVPTDSIVKIVAEADGLSPVAPPDLPESATFWVVTAKNGVTAPWPCPPRDASCSFFAIAPGQYLADMTGGKVSTEESQTVEDALAGLADATGKLITWIQEAQVTRSLARAMGREAELETPSDFSPLFAMFDTNSALYLQISNVADGLADVELHNGSNTVYAIWGTTNLAGGNWTIEREIFPTNSEVMPFTVPTLGRDALLLRAEDLSVKDSDGDGVPDWWIWKYFGDFPETATNLDGGGANTLLYDYTNGIDPNRNLEFTVRLGNQHFNTTNATGSHLVLNAVPGYEAVLMNDTNLNDAVWTDYDGMVHLNLGPTDGVYQVWIGLKGHAPDSPPVWVGTSVYLDRVAPAVTVTNPVNTTVTVPYLQLQGFADESLQSMTYAVSNAVGVATNQPGQLLGGQFFDTNQWQYTTDYFQCFDIPLTNGVNAITIHATDLAGNETATNINVMLDYTAATNPVVQLTWPQDGMQLCGDNFTLRGRVDDPTAQIAAQITNTNGDTNVLTGTVERTGAFWVENLPLGSGTNWVTLWVTNAAGWGCATNFHVVKSSMTLTLTTISGGLWLPTVSVSGNISDATASVFVNGVQGTNNGDGTWSAKAVPVSAGGVASFDLNAIPSGGDSAASTNMDKPTEVVVESGHWKEWSDYLTNNWTHLEWNYSIQSGGSMYNDWWYDNIGETIDSTYRPDKSMISQHSVVHSFTDPDFSMDGTNGDLMETPYALGALAYPPDSLHMGGIKSAQVKVALHIGGKGVAGGQVLVEAGVGSGTEALAGTPSSLGIDVTNLTVEGLGENLGPDGLAYGKAATGSSVNINLTAPVPFHSFIDGGGTHTLDSVVIACDLPDTRRTLGIGEAAVCYISPGIAVDWSVTGGGSLSSTNGVNTTFTAPKSPGTSTVHAKKNGAELTLDFNVIAPSSITIISNWDNPFGTNNDPNGVSMKARTEYLCIINPTNVSFENVAFRENVSPIIINWPDKSVETNMSEIGFPALGCSHLMVDEISVQASTSRIFNGTNYVDFSYPSTWTDQYQDDSGNWVDFSTRNVIRVFRGSDRQAQVIYMGIPGGWQGPY